MNKSISEIVFPILKAQFITCSENECEKCFENRMGCCTPAIVSNEIEVALINEGYGNVKQTAKDIFQMLYEIDKPDENNMSYRFPHLVLAHKIKEKYGIIDND